MWFLATRNRPDQCAGLVAAFRALGEVEPKVAVMIDDDPGKYWDVDWPEHWDIHVAPEHLEMTRAHNMLLAMYPGRPCYGFFGDHFRPTHPGMFRELREAAGDWFMAWLIDKEGTCWGEMSGAPTFGSKLISELGWINLPTTIHISTECPYTLLWQKLGIAKVLNITFDRTWPNPPGSVPRIYEGRDYNDADGRAYYAWMKNEAPGIIERIRGAMISDGIEFGDDGKVHPKYGCSKYGHRPERGG